MRDYRKLVQENIDWLFEHYDLMRLELTKSVENDREWDLVIKLKFAVREEPQE